MPILEPPVAATRHVFAWLRPDWPLCLRADLDVPARQTITAWVDRDLPFVVARSAAGDSADVVRLGLSLPDKTRLGVCLHHAAVRALQRPPLLDDARHVAPPAWRGTIDAILDETRRYDVHVRTYGSLAWQAVTSIEYVRPTSDLDLLLTCDRWSAIELVLQRLSALTGPPRLDGEVLLTDGSGIAWREIAGGARALLVKGPNDVSMVPRADVIGRHAGQFA